MNAIVVDGTRRLVRPESYRPRVAKLTSYHDRQLRRAGGTSTQLVLKLLPSRFWWNHSVVVTWLH
jgi:uncharacterized protein YjeT (DUF2065 family)